MATQVDPGFGKPYGQLASIRTTDGRLVTMYRRGQRVRFFDLTGQQVGPEQRNVAPAICAAMHAGWDLEADRA